MKRKYLFNTKQVLLTIVIAAAALSGCKKFLDVNANPNNPDSAAPNLLLPVSEAAAAQVIGNSFQVFGSYWSQYWTQSPTASQYRTYDQYNPTTTTFDRPWGVLYRNSLFNADLITKNNGLGLEYTKGIAHLVKAYTLQVITDAFGDVPVKEALQASVYTSPHYDAQKVVYDSVFYNIDRGLALLNTSTSLAVGAQDIIFQGNIANWKAFANTLKLKAFLRLAYIDAPRAQAGIAALYATSPTFLTIDASIKYTTTGGNENPFYNEMQNLGRTQNVVASSTVVGRFDANNDPRVGKLYDLLATSTTAKTDRSIAQGTYNLSANSGHAVSPPSPLTGGRGNNITSATAPVKLISLSESWFLQAEAVARGWATGNLADLYEKGIRASFVAAGFATAGTEANAYIGTTPTYADGEPDAMRALLAAAFEADPVEARVKAIITQKYYAMCGFQGFEAWTEWRRTGYPSFFVKSTASTIGGVRMPLRMLYPASEGTTNTNYPGLKVIYTPVWWDTKHSY